jgi:hypothetical protein
MRRLLAPLREAAWLTAERATIAGWMLLAGLVLIAAVLLGTSRDGINREGVPLGGDFTCYFTASWLALREKAALAYDHAAMRAAQIEVLGGDYGFLPFFYPPLWLLLCLPFALVPYAVAHAAFVGGTALACWRGLRALHPQRWAVLPLLAFPAFWTNATYGQNGFLSAALLAGAVRHLDGRPALAGVCFGLLAYKPQLGLAVPLALAVTGRWRVFAAAAATVFCFAAAATLAFGAGIWAEWLGSAGIGRIGMERGAVQFERFASWFGAVRLAGGGVGSAYAVQAIVAAGAAALLVSSLRRRPGARAEGALLVACTPLLTHYTLEYDLVILALPMAWLMAEAVRGGFLPWERFGLAVVFMLPMLNFALASATGIQLLPLATAVVFLLVARRVAADAAVPLAGERLGRARAGLSLG